ncbi:DUF2147 domain-containing protein [Flavobacteriales bacterium]|nr:DUF2147 domain-containing protein [Flavobacteriales bacterium]
MRRNIIIALVALFTMSFVTTTNAPSDEDRVLGVWMESTGKAKVKISKIGNKYFGKIVWLKEPIDAETNEPKLDKNNPNAELQGVKLKGLRIFKDFVYAGDGLWNKGTIYDSRKGKTYSCKITMKDINTLDIRGFVGISLLGRTDTWTRQ